MDAPFVTDAPFLIDPSRLAEAIAWAEGRYHRCDICPERCYVDRYAGPSGHCRLGEHGRVYKEYLHFGEEADLVPSHAIYLAGCNLRCAFCSDHQVVSDPASAGVEVLPEAVALRIAQRRREGAENVNFVGGVPDVNLLYVLRILAHVPADTHVVWNTNMWTVPAAMKQLDGIVGTWLADFKFGNDSCARKLAGVVGYGRRVRGTLALAAKQQQAGSSRLYIRHLLMPGHLECCTHPVLAHIAKHLPDATVNLMTGYHPYRLARGAGAMSGKLPEAERRAAIELFDILPNRRRRLDGVEYPSAK